MPVESGSQIVLCDMPIRFDTYGGCSHGCKYCFAQKRWGFDDIQKRSSQKALLNFINGSRTKTTNWCDWDIPIHWGGMSDPFQPAERKFRGSYECLKIFAKTQYPVVISTKGKLICDPEYLRILRKCNVVVQVSMASSMYDKIETGCPSFEERLQMVKILSKNVKRVIIRVQPYMPEIYNDLMKNIPRFAEAGAYGITIEGMKFAKKKDGMVRVGGDWCYPKALLKHDYEHIRTACHANKLKFFCAENRLRKMGDSMNCCGIDGLEGFKGNSYNLSHLFNGDIVEPTEQMKKVGTANCFSAINQSSEVSKANQQRSFYGAMMRELKIKKKHYKEIFGVEE